MPIFIQPEMQRMVDRINALHERTQVLADRHGRSYIDELERMVELDEHMETGHFYYLPGPVGSAAIPVFEVSGLLIERRSKE